MDTPSPPDPSSTPRLEQPPRPDRQIVVIGAGAAGMMAATQAALRTGNSGASKVRVILLEKNSKTGVKILMSGGTRCNITHDTNARRITDAFGHAKRFLQPSVGRFDPSQVVQFFNQAGVATKVESTGKIFPKSDRAVHVRDALHQATIDAGVDLRLRCGVQSLHRDDTHARWHLSTETETLTADAVIVTAGGRSWPGCGTTGDAYPWLATLGHTIIRPRPALVPLVGGEPWLRELSGITLEDCTATVREKNQQGEVKLGRKSELVSRRSSLLLTHFGLSGPAAMDVSGVMTAAKSWQDVQLQLDLVPGKDIHQLQQELLGQGADPRRRLSQWLRDQRLPQRLADALIGRTESASKVADPTIAQLPSKRRGVMIDQLKHLSIPIAGTKGFEKAEVTAGGVSLAEIDPKTMQSRRHPGLFIAGEVLDVDGWIGGYNFQAAFSTGHLAGTVAADFVTQGSAKCGLSI